MSSSVYAGGDSDEEAKPRKKLDKGKGKAKVMPELPEDVWKIVFEMYYDQVCEGWQSTGRMEHGLTPLLISPFITLVGIAVLYAHPHLSDRSIDGFLNNVQKPCSYLTLDSKLSLVRHLTVRPTPTVPRVENIPWQRPDDAYVNPSFHQLMRLFPKLHSFVLKDCLIMNRRDAMVVFGALPLSVPKKARLEIRMEKHDGTKVPRDLAASTRLDPPAFPRVAAYRSLRDTRTVGEWRDALFDDTQVDLPGYWLDPGDRTFQRSDRPHYNGPGINELNRAIDLVGQVLRVNYSPSQIPTREEIRRAIQSMGHGPYHLAEARQMAQTLLYRLGHNSLVNAPQKMEERRAMIATIWTAQFQVPRPTPPPAATTHLQSPRPLLDPSSKAQQQQQDRDLAKALDQEHNRTKANYFAWKAKRSYLSSAITDAISDTTLRPQSLGAGDDDVEATMLQEAVRRSRQLPELALGESHGSSSTSHGSAPVPEDGDDIALHPLSAAVAIATKAITASSNDITSDPPGAGPKAAVSLLDAIVPKGSEGVEPIDPSLVAGVPSDPENDSLYDEMIPGIDSSDDDDDDDDGILYISTRRAAHLGAAPRHTSWNTSVNHTFNVEAGNIVCPDNITAELYHTPENDSIRLAAALRAQLLRLIDKSWSPRLQAFSLVAVDPLASVIAQSPTLELWVNVAVPHIRVHLPRGINSLAVFKGTTENLRDRFRAAMLEQRSRQISSSESDDATNGAHSSALRSQYPQAQVVDPIVGGDGSGGGLVHPDNKLFEIEVNTVWEMTDDLWLRAGSELPPQVCRILTGEQDWSNVVLGAKGDVRQEPEAPPSPKTDDYASPPFSGSDGNIDSDDGHLADFTLDNDGSPGSGYDAEAARAQAERIAQRKRARAADVEKAD